MSNWARGWFAAVVTVALVGGIITAWAILKLGPVGVLFCVPFLGMSFIMGRIIRHEINARNRGERSDQ